MTVDYLDDVKKQLKKLDKSIQKRILDYMDEVSELENPRSRGKALAGNLSTLWRYRIGSYRAICDIQDNRLLIMVIDVGHRSDIYKHK